MSRAFWSSLAAAWRREFLAYFATPLAYVFITIFLILSGLFTWDLSRFFDTGEADLQPFFYWHPWLYMLFMPALAMRLWSEEAATGTYELLLSLPVSLAGVIMGKFLAAWAVAAIALLLTLPWWITVNILGPADTLIIILSYAVSFLMAGGYIALGCAVSARTSSPVLAFISGVVFAFLMTIAGWPIIVGALSDIFGTGFGGAVALFSFPAHFETAQRGVLEWRGIFFYISFIALCLALNYLFVDYKRSGAG